MTHRRETLLAAIVTQIKAAATTVGNKVYRGRRLPVEDAELPVCLVYQGDEASEFNDLATDLKRRRLNVTIEIHQDSDPATLNDPGIETALNALSEEIEDALEADFTVGGNALFFEHQSTTVDIETGEVDRGVIRLGLMVDYRTVRTDSST